MRHSASLSQRAIASAAAATLVFSTAGYAAIPTVNFDLRVHGTGDKEAMVYRTGDAIQLDLYATVFGLDQDPLNDRITLGGGFVTSSAGGQLGDLLGIAPPAPFNLNGS